MNDIQASLSALLKALGEGVVQSSKLPTEDAFEFEKSFPEFARQLSSAQYELVKTLKQVLDEIEGPRGGGDREGNEGNDPNEDACEYDIYDAAFWEKCEDACEALLDQIDDEFQGNSKDADATRQTLQYLGKRAHAHGSTAFAKMQSNVVDMVKPQVSYKMRRAHNSRTEPFVPLLTSKPNAVEPLDLSPQEGHGLEGRFPVRGDSSASSARYASSPQLVAPTTHVPNPYRAEIEQFVYRDDQLEVPSTSSFASKLVPQHPGPLRAEWIDTPQQLEKLVRDLQDRACAKDCPRLVLAMDLEAHGWRSFSGMTCLMQLSYRAVKNEADRDSTKNDDNDDSAQSSTIRNYLVDTLQLQSEMHQLLPVLTNPDVVKVMHGADSDVLWLQRDFGLYIVNLFDTGRAARELHLPSASYAHLLHKYVGINADKSHQLADWRQRPLPTDMVQYAIQDTHYLLDIYDRLRADLQTPERIRAVLDVSRLVCLSRYAVEPFDPDGYAVLTSTHRSRGANSNSASSGRMRQDLDEAQESVLRGLWDWRDRVARDEDESVHYVCPKSALLRIALACHQLTNLRSLQSLFNPMPSPLILQHADEILGMVQDELKKAATTRSPSKDPKAGEGANQASAATAGNLPSNPDRPDADDDEMRAAAMPPKLQPSGSSSFGASAFLVMKSRGSGGTSPVLGTEALYRQAGWVTPHEKLRALANAAAAETTSSSTSSAGEEGQAKARHNHGVTLHLSNKNYQSGYNPPAKLLLGGGSKSSAGPASRTVDGMATVRAARGDGSGAAPGDSTLEEELRRAKQNSDAVQAKLRGSLPSVLGLVTPVIDLEEDDTAPLEDGRESRIRDAYGGRDDEDFVIPRSMREIYTISNRNRRNKKAGSPTPERGVTPTTEKEREELARAEALLREHGLLPSPYFDDGTGGGTSPGKKARTKPSSSGRESEETVPQDSAAMASREDDFAVLKSIGWLPEGAASSAPWGKADGSDPTKHSSAYGFDFGQGDAKQPPSNPFFAGAALVGGPLAQGFHGRSDPQRSAKKPNAGGGGGGGRGGGKPQQQQGRRQGERPKKEEGRTHAYRKR